MCKYSVVVPVYNRPDEMDELLESLTLQTYKDFEILVIEDGSTVKCNHIVEKYKDLLEIRYYLKENSGPGLSRNFGANHAHGEWYIFLDSDTIIPLNYFSAINEFISKHLIDAFGGADRDREDFKPIQKAISYAMTSILTTGGIRGNKKSLEKFKPRSFNMGIRRDVFDKLNGFRSMRYGEDIDFSLRLENKDFYTSYVPEGFVYHKRRTSFRSFFNQIKHSGEARILLTKLHKGSLKLVHLLPIIFFLGLVFTLLMNFLSPNLVKILGLIYGFYFLIIGFHASLKTKSIYVGLLSIVASFIQLLAYGYGFLRAYFFSIK